MRYFPNLCVYLIKPKLYSLIYLKDKNVSRIFWICFWLSDKAKREENRSTTASPILGEEAGHGWLSDQFSDINRESPFPVERHQNLKLLISFFTALYCHFLSSYFALYENVFAVLRFSLLHQILRWFDLKTHNFNRVSKNL